MASGNSLKILFLALAFLTGGLASGQAKAGRQQDSLFARYALGNATGTRPVFYVCACGESQVPAGSLVRRISDEVSIIRLDDPGYGAPLSHLRMAPANNTWKLSPSLEQMQMKTGRREQRFNLTGTDTDSLLAALAAFPAKLRILAVNRPAKTAVVQCAPPVMQALLLLNQVVFADAVVTAQEEANIIGYDRSWHGINAVDFLIPGANGKNIVAGVKEQRIEASDIDVWKRVLPSPIASTNSTYHATVIASIIGGAGNSSYFGKGIAWGCRFFSSSFSNLFADDAAILNANRVTVQNHSYGTVVQQFYGSEALSYDQLAWQNKTFVAVMSAGNQGGAFATEGKYANLPGFANLTGNFKMAKNIISVAAIDKSGLVSALSSAGPLYDGRLAPQVTALGPNGTSDAAAIVTGTAAVMQQVYADSNSGVLPPAALVKAVMYNTADDIYYPGIDYKTGYGLLNSYAAVRSIQKKEFDTAVVSQGQQWTRQLTVPANAAALHVTLAWTDPEAQVNNFRALTNDLDLEVVEQATGKIYRPWVLHTTAHRDSLALPPVRKRDSLNTAEQVSISLPPPGLYQVKVSGTLVAPPGMHFSVAYKTDTLHTFQFTSPLHASDVNRVENEQLNIRWQTFVADTTETGNLFISYNSGADWVLIGAAVRLGRQRFTWPIKDTSAAAVLKMETAFGVFLSRPFIISKMTRLRVEFNCADSFRLSWNQHIFATAYRLYGLTDSPYLKALTVFTDTFAVLPRAAYPYINYAVEPLLSNGVSAARSDVLNITLQNVHCFYKTLNYSLPDKNQVLLALELSTQGYVDSIFFEKVTASGQLVTAYAGMKAGSGLAYDQLVDNPAAGLSYFRARLKLKNGATVYTEMISVLAAGERKIWFYPSPVRRGEALSYILQQGVDGDSQLLLYDIMGRLLLRLPSISNTIDVSRFAPGVVVYKLVDQENQILETGKILVL